MLKPPPPFLPTPLGRGELGDQQLIPRNAEVTEDIRNPCRDGHIQPTPEQVQQDRLELQQLMHDKRLELTQRRMKGATFKRRIREYTPNIAQQMKMGKRITIPGQDQLIQRTPHGISRVLCINQDPMAQGNLDHHYSSLRENFQFARGPLEDCENFPANEGNTKETPKIMKLDARRGKKQDMYQTQPRDDSEDEFPPILYGSDTLNKIKTSLCNSRGETLETP